MNPTSVSTVGAFVAALALLAAGCGGDMQTYKSEHFEFDYKLYPAAGTPAPRIEFGDSVYLHYVLSNGKDDIVSSYELGQAPIGLSVPAKMHRNSFEEALTLVGAGDSLEVHMSAEQAGEAVESFAAAFEQGQPVIYRYRIHRVRPRASVEAFKDTLYAAQRGFASVDAYHTERKALQLRVDTVVAFVAAQAAKRAQLKTSKTVGGLEYVLLQSDEQAAARDTVFLHFLLQTEQEGRILDNTFKTADRFVYYGQELQAPMWKEALPLLRPGSRLLFFVPAALGYGKQGVPNAVPPDSRLVWYVEVY